MDMTPRLIAGLAGFALAIPAAQAQQASEDWQAIDALTAVVANAMGRTATPIDRRIKLQRCPEQAAITAIDSQTLAVRCASLGWRVRVPMTGGASAAPGLAPASYARPAAPVIRRGDNVRVSIETDSFAINYSAVASEDGRVGDTIALRDTGNRSSLSAIVTGPGRARIAD
jgi:flagella basal body P-ring formation protein FlgA